MDKRKYLGIHAIEVFQKLNLKRNFKGNDLIFNDEESSVELLFKSNNAEDFKDICYFYGLMDDKEVYDVEFTIFFNGKKVINEDIDFKKVKNNDCVKIYYNDIGCFNLFSHLLLYEIDENHEDDYHFRKELEK
jgi:hypothetical protein